MQPPFNIHLTGGKCPVFYSGTAIMISAADHYHLKIFYRYISINKSLCTHMALPNLVVGISFWNICGVMCHKTYPDRTKQGDRNSGLPAVINSFLIFMTFPPQNCIARQVYLRTDMHLPDCRISMPCPSKPSSVQACRRRCSRLPDDPVRRGCSGWLRRSLP